MREFDEIRIENTNRCGYHCVFCPRELHVRTQGVMSVEDLALILDRLSPQHRGSVDLHGFGEPLLDEFLITKAAMVRARWPETRIRIYSTLGVRHSPELMARLAESEIDEINVSLYGHDAESYQAIHGRDRWDEAHANLHDLTNALEKTGGKLRVVVRRTPVHDEEDFGDNQPERREAMETQLAGQGVAGFVERSLHNYGRGRAYNEPGRQSVCSVTWGLRKRILQITWDLNVIPCAFDFNGDVKLGNLRHQTLDQIFGDAIYRDFIAAHESGNLQAYSPCAGCEKCPKP